jgi:hypothetical protein
MKNSFLKSVAMPLATVVLGLAGAFVTTSMGSAESFAQVRGHYFLNAQQPCVQSVMCQDTDNGFICTSPTNVTLYGKISATSADCQLPLWKINP